MSASNNDEHEIGKPQRSISLNSILKRWPIAGNRKKPDQKILDLIERLQNLLNVGMVYAFIYDHVKEQPIFISKFIKEITGYSKRKFRKVLSSPEKSVHTQDLTRLYTQLREVGNLFHQMNPEERKNHTFTVTYRMMRADKKYILVLHEFFVMDQNADGDIVSTFNFCKEISDSDPRIQLDLMINPAISWYKNDTQVFRFKLSDREKELLSLLANGHKTHEISKKLFLSPHTISTHRKRLLRKFNQKNTASLVIFARENDLI